MQSETNTAEISILAMVSFEVKKSDFVHAEMKKPVSMIDSMLTGLLK